MNKTAIVAATALCIGTPALAQDRTAAIDRMFDWVTVGSPGCVVAASHNGQRVVNRAYGLADISRNRPLDATSAFDAASIVKQFVAASVLLLVEDGRLSLDDKVHKHIPQLPDYGHTITINHLLTHTSGIRDWTGILPLTDDSPDALTLTLRQRGLDFAPGEEWAYSNGGYVLLKEIVERVSGMSFADFTRRRLFEPLGMTSTVYRIDLETFEPNRARAYEKGRDSWEEDMDLGTQRGGGGALISTASDLVTWGDALSSNRLGAFVSEKLVEPARLNNGRQLHYGRAIFLDANYGGPVLWHTGGSAGYRSILVRHPQQKLTTAIMCNSGEVADRTAFARQIFEMFVPGDRNAEAAPPTAATRPAAANVSPTDLSARAGLFFSERTGLPLRVIVNGGRLGIAGSGPLIPLDSARFRNPSGSLSFMSQAEFEVRFVSSDEFEMKTKEGVVTRYRRAQPHAPTPAELATFSGRYSNDELRSLVEIVPDGAGLIMRSVATPEKSLTFTAVGRETFMLRLMTIRFIRDDAGNVIGYDYSNPVVRNLRYTRGNGPAR